MLKNIAKIAIGAAIALGILGCGQHALTQRESLLDQNWGRSFEAARANQTLNPEAAESLSPVEGLAGPAAARIMDSYISGGNPQQESSPEFGVVTIKQ
jgi:hypothetical protein